MANNFIHHGRRACESHHFWDLDFIMHRIQITEKTVKIRRTLLNFVSLDADRSKRGESKDHGLR